MSLEVILAGLFSGMIGAMGFGGGGVLLIYLTVFASVAQLQAQGINLLFFLPCGALAVFLYMKRGRIKWKTVIKMWLGGGVGAVLGYLLASAVNEKWLSFIFASFLIIFGIYQLFSKDKKISTRQD